MRKIETKQSHATVHLKPYFQSALCRQTLHGLGILQTLGPQTQQRGTMSVRRTERQIVNLLRNYTGEAVPKCTMYH
jgi:hypothetical protein